jgi:NADPH2:quinone reductase
LPAILGREAAGRVVATGDGVPSPAVGDRVAVVLEPGGYSEERLAPADRCIPLPEEIDDVQAAAVMLKGLTAQFLLRRACPVGEGDPILIHAAAGGVGLVLCQWARHLGATVLGTVGTDAKAEIARAHGCDHPIVYTREDFVGRVREITGGAGVRVVYDSVGKDTLARSLDCLRPLGMLVSFGQSSGVPPPLEIGVLAAKGSLFLTRPTLFHYVARREDLWSASSELLDLVRRGIVKAEVGRTYPLGEAARAHRDLEGRKTTGSLVLLI